MFTMGTTIDPYSLALCDEQYSEDLVPLAGILTEMAGLAARVAAEAREWPPTEAQPLLPLAPELEAEAAARGRSTSD